MFTVDDARRLLQTPTLSPEDRLTVAHMANTPVHKWSNLDIEQLENIAAKVQNGEVYSEKEEDDDIG